MKVTNNKTNKYAFVGDTTIKVLNYLAAKALVARKDSNKQGYFYCTLKEVAEKFDVSSTTINYHLGRLRALGIVDVRVCGRNKSIYKVGAFTVTEI